MCQQCYFVVNELGEEPSIYNDCPICENCGMHMDTLEKAQNQLCDRCEADEDYVPERRYTRMERYKKKEMV